MFAILAMSVFLAFTFTVTAVLNGWFICTVWNWIAVPAFHAPHLTIPAAVGLACLASAIRPYHATATNKNESAGDAWTDLAGWYIGHYGIGLLIAYIVKGML